ncbi:MAG TPA: hypothetical protein VF883_04190 [Thermoanaerobaculia bacterium]
MTRTLALLIVTVVSFAAAAEDYTVTRFAGAAADTGAGYRDGTGSVARFNEPVGIAVGAAGHLYVADRGNNTIRRIGADGVVTTVAGRPGQSGFVNGRGGEARFGSTHTIAVDSQGNVYVPDAQNDAVRRISAEGVVSTFATFPFASSPYGVAVDGLGNVFVMDVRGIHKFTPSGGSSSLVVPGSSFTFPSGFMTIGAAGEIFFTDGHFLRKVTPAGAVTTVAEIGGFPRGLAIDGSGNFIVALVGDRRIVKVTETGTVTNLAGGGFGGSVDGDAAAASFDSPMGLAVNAAGDVFVCDLVTAVIRRIAPSGVVSTIAGTPHVRPASSTEGDLDTATFAQPTDVAADSLGNRYVADGASIRKITPDGQVTTLAGSAHNPGTADGLGSAARFRHYVAGLAVDSAGNVYATDHYAHTIRKITPSGLVTTYAGFPDEAGTQDGQGTGARFFEPMDLTLDPSGNLYVTDYGSNVIRKITPAGMVTTIAGLAGAAGTSNGTGASARFDHPAGIGLDSSGNLYVADMFNRTIRKITTEHVVTTFAGAPGQGATIDGNGSSARFSLPWSLEVDANDTIWVYDRNALRRITTSADVSTAAGSQTSRANVEGTGPLVRFYDVSGMGTDAEGNLFLASQSAATIVRARPPGIDDAAMASSLNPAIHTAVTLGMTDDVAQQWTWSIVRRPPGSSAQLSSTTANAVTFTPDVADLFTIQVRAEGPAGIRYSTVDIVPSEDCEPLKSVTASIDEEEICSSNPPQAVVHAVGGVASIQWGWRATPAGATHAISGATSATYAPTAADLGDPGPKYLVATVTSSCGVPVASNPVQVTVPPTPAISASSGVYANSTNNFASVLDAGAGTTYAWSITNGTITSGQGTRSIRYTAGAFGEVTLGITVNNGCEVNGQVYVPVIARPAGASLLYLVTPCRVIDTRGNPVADGATRTLTIGGLCNVPVGATAIALNVTAVAPAATGYAALYPSNVAWPGSSTINYRAARTRANNAIVAVAPDGTINLRNVGATTDFIIDVTGYFQ